MAIALRRSTPRTAAGRARRGRGRGSRRRRRARAGPRSDDRDRPAGPTEATTPRAHGARGPRAAPPRPALDHRTAPPTSTPRPVRVRRRASTISTRPRRRARSSRAGRVTTDVGEATLRRSRSRRRRWAFAFSAARPHALGPLRCATASCAIAPKHAPRASTHGGRRPSTCHRAFSDRRCSDDGPRLPHRRRDSLGGRMRVWVDLTNSPHVLVLRPIVAALRAQGHDVQLTARDFAQTIGLLERFGIEHTRGRPPPRRQARGEGARARLALGGARALGAQRGASTSPSATAPTTSRSPRGCCGSPARRCSTTSGRRCSTRVNCRLAQTVVVPDAIPPQRARALRRDAARSPPTRA